MISKLIPRFIRINISNVKKIIKNLIFKNFKDPQKDILTIRISDIEASKKTFIYNKRESKKNMGGKINFLTEIITKLIYSFPSKENFFKDQTDD